MGKKILLFITFFSLALCFMLLVDGLSAQTISCSSSTNFLSFEAADNDEAFKRALDWAMQYFKAFIRFLVRIFCAAIKVFGVKCG